MNNTDLTNGMYQYGRNKALELRESAPSLTDTEVIDQEAFIPEWKPGVQVLNAPVRRSELDQNYRVLQGHDSTASPDWTPETQPALFGIMHTKNPAKAKPWAEPMGTSGVYKLDECYREEDGIVWQQIYDGDNVYDAKALPERWVQVRG